MIKKPSSTLFLDLHEKQHKVKEGREGELRVPLAGSSIATIVGPVDWQQVAGLGLGVVWTLFHHQKLTVLHYPWSSSLTFDLWSSLLPWKCLPKPRK